MTIKEFNAINDSVMSPLVTRNLGTKYSNSLQDKFNQLISKNRIQFRKRGESKKRSSI